MSWRERFGLVDLRVDREDLRRLLLLLVVCTLCAVMVVDYANVPREQLAVGDVAPRTVKAPYSFNYQDFADRERRQREARETVAPVFVHRANLDEELGGRLSDAFAAARGALAEVPAPEPESPPDARSAPDAPPRLAPAPTPLAPSRVAPAAPAAFLAGTRAVEVFRARLGVHVPEEDLLPLLDAGFPAEAEALAVRLLARALGGYVIADKGHLPETKRAVRVIEVRGAEREEVTVTDFSQIASPPEARQQVSLGLLEAKPPGPWVESVAAITRALVRPNLAYDHLETEERRERAASEVPMAPVPVKRGTTLFRQGDVLTEQHLVQYGALVSSRGQNGVAPEIAAVGLFLFLLFVSLYHFGASYLQDFSVRVADSAAVGFLLVLTALLARVIVASSEGIAGLVGQEATATSVWFMVPVAGMAMLVRLLVGVAWTVVFSVGAAALCGLVMDLQALYLVFFVLSSIAAAGAVEHTRERMAVLRAGLFAGIVNAAAVLLIHLLQLFISDGEVSLGTTMRPVWSMLFGLVGGMLSGGLVLMLVPLFESAGFVTDYRLMELANLNHPLLRQLMLRAPGSYHHSVVVGSLAEAACEAVGANALQARVASYFHDIGKALKPQYFVENQRGDNRHDRLDPYASAQIIISHVTEGGRMAREHGLPKPIVDNIYMHHGTGLLQFFYGAARAEAGDRPMDDGAFRYPGPKPDTREAGIIMLADKVEAATRTIRQPNEDSIRSMIHKIVNSVIADGQFEKCPLTLQEIHTVSDTFVKVLVGIYHHRIEYAATADISRGNTGPHLAPVQQEAVITLEIAPTPARGAQAAGAEGHPPVPLGADADADYEAVEHLPRG